MKEEFISTLNKLIFNDDKKLNNNINQILFIPNENKYILSYEIIDLYASAIQTITFELYKYKNVNLDDVDGYIVKINDYYYAAFEYNDISDIIYFLTNQSTSFNTELLEYVKNLI
jgi:hypothetical protein